MSHDNSFQTTSDALFEKGMRRIGFSIGERSWTFFRGLRWNATTAFISRILCGVATLFAARWMGPTGFGEASLALASTFWIQVPLFLGIPTALMHYVPQAPHTERESWADTGLALLLTCSFITLLIGFLYEPFWARLQGVSPQTFQLGLIWCAGFMLHNAATALLSAYERFPARAKCQLMFAILFPIFIAYFWKTGRLTAPFYIVAFTGAYGLSGLIWLMQGWSRRVFAPGAENRIRKILSYGLLASLGSVENALFNAPGRLIVNKYLPLASVGVLSAYQGGSIYMALFFLGPATQVFFPIASRTPDRKVLFEKISRLMWLTSPFQVMTYAVITTLYIAVLGKGYPLSGWYITIFSIAAFLGTFYGLIGWFLASEGRKGLIVSVLLGLISGAANAVCCYILIPRWGLIGAGLAYGFGSLLGILMCYGYMYLAYRNPKLAAN